MSPSGSTPPSSCALSPRDCDSVPWIKPDFPKEMARFDMRIRYLGHSLDLRLTRDALTVRGHDCGVAPSRRQGVRIGGQYYPLIPDYETTKYVAGLNGVQLKTGHAPHFM
ncbi:glycosyl hydrolase family 65 protein [Stutzerimonas stutzeri]|uniref:glycosyl hydrolase family 65 protein n=1 Tax=Stutzerimonas stutzeri TaxID=316 RepID=UPI003C6F58E7